MNETFGQILRKWRVQSSMSQAEAAGALGVTQGYLCRLERGACAPSVQLMRRLDGCLDLDSETVSQLHYAGARAAGWRV